MQDSTLCFLQELHIKCEDTGQLKVKEEWKRDNLQTLMIRRLE